MGYGKNGLQENNQTEEAVGGGAGGEDMEIPGVSKK